MASDGPATARDDWDLVWQAYDRRHAGPVPRPDAAPAVPRRRARGPVLALACCLAGCLALAPGLVTVLAELSDAKALAGPVSLAPDEAALPPLSVAIARLAAESADAACWVRRLDPRGRGCAPAATEAAAY